MLGSVDGFSSMSVHSTNGSTTEKPKTTAYAHFVPKDSDYLDGTDAPSSESTVDSEDVSSDDELYDWFSSEDRPDDEGDSKRTSRFTGLLPFRGRSHEEALPVVDTAKEEQHKRWSIMPGILTPESVRKGRDKNPLSTLNEHWRQLRAQKREELIERLSEQDWLLLDPVLVINYGSAKKDFLSEFQKQIYYKAIICEAYRNFQHASEGGDQNLRLEKLFDFIKIFIAKQKSKSVACNARVQSISVNSDLFLMLQNLTKADAIDHSIFQYFVDFSYLRTVFLELIKRKSFHNFSFNLRACQFYNSKHHAVQKTLKTSPKEGTHSAPRENPSTCANLSPRSSAGALVTAKAILSQLPRSRVLSMAEGCHADAFSCQAMLTANHVFSRTVLNEMSKGVKSSSEILGILFQALRNSQKRVLKTEGCAQHMGLVAVHKGVGHPSKRKWKVFISRIGNGRVYCYDRKSKTCLDLTKQTHSAESWLGNWSMGLPYLKNFTLFDVDLPEDVVLIAMTSVASDRLDPECKGLTPKNAYIELVKNDCLPTLYLYQQNVFSKNNTWQTCPLAKALKDHYREYQLKLLLNSVRHDAEINDLLTQYVNDGAEAEKLYMGQNHLYQEESEIADEGEGKEVIIGKRESFAVSSFTLPRVIKRTVSTKQKKIE